jgi:cobaltochelatase CobN
MHRLATIPGGWNPAAEGVIFVEQQPAPIAFITAADTDIQTLAVATTQLSADFPQVRVVNLLQLQQQLTIDTYAEDVLTAAKVIIVRLIGGQSYWSYGLEVVQETARQTGASRSDVDEPFYCEFGGCRSSVAISHRGWSR